MATMSNVVFSHLFFRQFTWVDDKGKKQRMSAPQYIELVILSVEKFVTDEASFPTKFGELLVIHFSMKFWMYFSF